MMKYMKHLVYFLIFFLTINAGFAKAEPAGENVGEIVSISGSVEVLLSGETKSITAEADMFLQAGDKVKTGRNSYVEVAFDEDAENLVRLNSDASAVFTLKDDEKIELIEGEVFAIINKLKKEEKFEIRTPTAIAGVRGTEWVTKVSQEGTDVEAINGSPYVKGFESDGRPMLQEIIVKTGYMTRVKKFQRPLALTKLSEQRIKRFINLRGEIKNRALQAIEKRKLIPGQYRRLERMQNDLKKRIEIKRKLKIKDFVPESIKRKPSIRPKPKIDFRRIKW